MELLCSRPEAQHARRFRVSVPEWRNIHILKFEGPSLLGREHERRKQNRAWTGSRGELSKDN